MIKLILLAFIGSAIAQNNRIPFILGNTTVALLPTCSLTAKGGRATATDLVGPQVDGGPVVGGGSLTWLVICNGTTWYQEFAANR